MSELRAATSECHRRLEKRLNVADRFATVAGYRGYLEVMFGFHAPLEQLLSRHPVRRVLPDFDARCKADLLSQDLTFLGVGANSIGTLPRCVLLPSCQDEAAAFGCLYVMEGATLGGQVLLPIVERRLHLTDSNGARYLSSYGPEVGGMWQRFCATIEDWCSDQSRRAVAAAAAVATFESLEAWMFAARGVSVYAE